MSMLGTRGEIWRPGFLFEDFDFDSINRLDDRHTYASRISHKTFDFDHFLFPGCDIDV